MIWATLAAGSLVLSPALAAPAKTNTTTTKSAKAPAKQAPSQAKATKKKVPTVSLLSNVLASKTVRACVRTDVPPFGYFQGRTLQGFDISLAEEIVNAMSIRFQTNLSLKWVVIRASARVSALQRGSCDFVIAAFSKTAARQKAIDFTKVYYKTNKVIIKKNGESQDPPVVGMVRSTTGGAVGNNNAIIAKFSSYGDILYTMQQKLVDYVVTDAPIGRYMCKQSQGAYRVHRILPQVEAYSVGVPKGQKAWLQELDKAIHVLQQSGRLALLHKKWLD